MLSDVSYMFENIHNYNDIHEYDETTQYITQRYDISDDVDSSLLNSIVQHPFIDELGVNLDNISTNKHKLVVVLYRINNHNKYHFVEYYLPNGEFITPILAENENLLYNIKNILSDIPGVKRIKGTWITNDYCYMFIQVRNNKLSLYWLVSWDVLANKHLYGISISQNTCEIILKINKCDNLYLNNQLCIKPVVLYCNIENRHCEYVNTHNTVQYCMKKDGPLITLHNYQPNDNVRNICFINDLNIDINMKLSDLSYLPHIIIQDGLITNWIFRSDYNIKSHVTSQK